MTDKSIRLCLLLAAIPALVICLSPETARSEAVGPGTYYGHYGVTRWGAKVFHTGPYEFSVSASVASQLEKYRGKPLELQVTQVEQYTNPGRVTIVRIGKVTVRSAAEGLVLSARMKSAKVIKGEGLVLVLTVSNPSDREITISSAALEIVFGGWGGVDSSYKDPDNRAYWYYGNYHAFPVPWSGAQMANGGRNIRITSMGTEPDGPVVLAPGAHFEDEVVVGRELLAGDYEVFFCLATGNFSSVAGPMSARLSFDVSDSAAALAPNGSGPTDEVNRSVLLLVGLPFVLLAAAALVVILRKRRGLRRNTRGASGA